MHSSFVFFLIVFHNLEFNKDISEWMYIFFCCKRQFIVPDTHFSSEVNNFKSFVNINTHTSPRLQPPFIGNTAIILLHNPK